MFASSARPIVATRDCSTHRCVIASAVLAPIAALMLGVAGANEAQTYAYALSNVYIASHPDDQACPKLSLTANQIFLQGLPEPQRAALADPAKERELSQLMYKKYGFKGGPTGAAPGRNGAAPSYTPEQIEEFRRKFKIPPGKGKLSYLGLMYGYNLCTDPDDFPDFAVGNAPYLGKVAFGIDLDGSNGRHDFTSPTGASGVDNALIQAIGCNRTTRDYGDPKIADNVITSLASPTLMVVSGVDDLTNDDDVTLRFFASDVPLELDASGKPLAWASLDADPDPRFQARAQARMRNGLLSSEPFDLRIRMREQIIDSYREIKGARVQFHLEPGASSGGAIYGYHTIDSLAEPFAQAGTVGLNLMSCPAAMQAIRQYGDGYPDPRTGKNTAISTALNFRAIPSFVVGIPRAAALTSKDRGQQ